VIRALPSSPWLDLSGERPEVGARRRGAELDDDDDGGGGLDADLARERLERPRDGAEDARGEVREVLVQGIELQWRGLDGATPAAALLGSGRREHEEEEEGKGKTKTALGGDKHELARKRSGRDGRHVDTDVEKRRRLRLRVEQGRRWSNGILVNNSRFQSPVRKLTFSPSSWPQMENF